VVFPVIVCVSAGDEGFQSKDPEVLRSARAGVEHHSCVGDALLCAILLKQDLLSAAQILYLLLSPSRCGVQAMALSLCFGTGNKKWL